MAREVFVALFKGLEAAEAARRRLEQEGVPVADIDLRSHELTGFAASDIAPEPRGLWADLFACEPQYRHHVDADGALLAVRADSDDYDRIASLLLHHDPVARPMLADKTSQSGRVRRYAIAGEESIPLHEEAISVRAKA